MRTAVHIPVGLSGQHVDLEMTSSQFVYSRDLFYACAIEQPYS